MKIEKNILLEKKGFKQCEFIKYFVPKKIDSDGAWLGLELDEEFNIVCYNDYFEYSLKENFKQPKKTIDNLWDGDIVFDGCYYRKVLKRTGNIIDAAHNYSFLESCKETNKYGESLTIEEIKDYGFEVYKEEIDKEISIKQKFKTTINNIIKELEKLNK